MPKTFEDKPMLPLPLECVTVAEWSGARTQIGRIQHRFI